jgi:hypothetical protein
MESSMSSRMAVTAATVGALGGQDKPAAVMPAIAVVSWSLSTAGFLLIRTGIGLNEPPSPNSTHWVLHPCNIAIYEPETALFDP